MTYYKTTSGKGYLAVKEPFEEIPDGYIEITEDEFNEHANAENPVNNYARIMELKRLLAESDYKAIKYAEGLITAEEYAPIKAERQAWRDEINELESV